MTIFRKNYKNPRKSEFPNFSYNLLRLHVCNLYLLVQTFNCTFHSLCWSHMTVNYGCSNKTLAFETETSLDWLIFCWVSCNFRIWIFHSDIVIIIASGYLRCGTFCLTQIFFVSSLSIFDFYQSTQFLVQNIDIHVDITSKFTVEETKIYYYTWKFKNNNLDNLISSFVTFYLNSNSSYVIFSWFCLLQLGLSKINWYECCIDMNLLFKKWIFNKFFIRRFYPILGTREECSFV